MRSVLGLVVRLLQNLLRTGPTRVESWEASARAMGAEYVPGGFFTSDRLRYASPPWMLTVDLHSSNVVHGVATFTRMRAPYISRGAFKFSIEHAGPADALARVFGRDRDIKIGDAIFDFAYQVHGNDEKLVRTLLADPVFRGLLPRRPTFGLQSKPGREGSAGQVPEGVHIFECWLGGIVEDQQVLKSLLELTQSALRRMCAIGVASDEAPRVVF